MQSAVRSARSQERTSVRKRFPDSDRRHTDCERLLMPGNSSWFQQDPPMTRRFALYLPSREKNGHVIKDFERIAGETADDLCRRFGGVTRYPATGYFRDSEGRSQGERIEVLEAFCTPEDWARESSSIRSLVRGIAHALHQESVACSLDGQMAIVEGSEAPSS